MAKVGFLLATGFEDSEMKNPFEQIRKVGHDAIVIGIKKGTLCVGKQNTVSYTTDMAIKEVDANDIDAVVIPGGSAPEELRINEDVVEFIKKMNAQSKLIAGICHGPQVMISANILNGKGITCYKGIRDDVINSGANFMDKEVVVSGNIITSRTPKDEPAFIREILTKLG